MFHVVHLCRWSKHFGYEIYYNNRRCIRMSDITLKKHEAYKLCRLLNAAA
jgi:hypothetical protein